MELVGDNICAQIVPFSFSHKDGGEEIKPAVIAYMHILSLWERIKDLLEQNNDNNKRYNYYTCTEA